MRSNHWRAHPDAVLSLDGLSVSAPAHTATLLRTARVREGNGGKFTLACCGSDVGGPYWSRLGDQPRNTEFRGANGLKILAQLLSPTWYDLHCSWSGWSDFSDSDDPPRRHHIGALGVRQRRDSKAIRRFQGRDALSCIGPHSQGFVGTIGENLTDRVCCDAIISTALAGEARPPWLR